MPKFIAVLTLIRALGVAIYMMAEAYKYGAARFGDGTWRNYSAQEHLDAALGNIVAWKRGDTDKPVLVDAALRVAFALAQAVSQGQQPAEYKK